MTRLLLKDHVEGMWKESVVVTVVTTVSMAQKDNIFCGLFNDDAAIAEYIVPMVKTTGEVDKICASSGRIQFVPQYLNVSENSLTQHVNKFLGKSESLTRL